MIKFKIINGKLANKYSKIKILLKKNKYLRLLITNNLSTFKNKQKELKKKQLNKNKQKNKSINNKLPN
jgi:hypothetical protein